MSYRPRPKHARVNVSNPSAWATCERCGLIGNLRDMVWDRQWSGSYIQNRRFLVHPHCYNIPNELLRTIILPADPPPALNARPENYAADQGVGLRVIADRHSMRVVIVQPGLRRMMVTAGLPSEQTSF